ncbi:MAG: ADP-ribosyltransferase [Myxococcota bacterium]
MAIKTQAPTRDDAVTPAPAKKPAPTNEFGFNSFGPTPATGPDLGPVYGPTLDEGSMLDGLMCVAPTMSTPARDTAAPTPPPAPAPVQAPVVDPAVVRARSTQLYRAMDGWGTDEDGVMSALRGMSPQEIAAIRTEFQNHYGRDLDAMIRDEMGGDDLAEANALLTADPVEATLAGLTNSLGTFNDDEEKIEDLMRDLSPEDRARMQQDPRWASVRDSVRDSLGGSDLEVFDALQTGDRATASAIRLDDAMGSSSSWYNPTSWGTDEDAVYEQLGSLPEAERAAVEERFNERMAAQGEQTTLRSELTAELSGADHDRAVAVLEGNRVDEQVARLAQTMEGLGTNESELFTLLEQPGLSPEMRAEISARYEELHGESLSAAVASETSGTDLERANGAIAGNGQQDPAFMLFYGMEGMGTDEDLLRSTLAGKSAEEIQQIRENWNSTYADRYGADFDAAFDAELSGRDHFDLVEIAMRGEPQNDQERAEILDLQYEYERGDRSTAFGRGYMNLMDDIGFSSSASQLDRTHKRLDALRDADGNLTGPEGSVSELYGWGQDDLQDYRTAKDSAGEALATGAEITVAAIATVLTDGAASPWLVAAVAGVAGGAAGMATRAAIQGEAYGREAIAADALKTVLSAGVSAGMASGTVAERLREISHVFGSEVANEIAESTLKGAVGGTLNGAVGGAMDENALRAGMAEYLAGIGQSSLMGGFTGALSGAANKGTEHALGIDQTTLSGSILNGAATNSAGAIVETAVTPGTYSGRPEDIALRFLQSAGKAGASGAIDGAVDYTTRARAVTHAILEEGKPLDRIDDFKNLSDAQRAEVLESILRSANPPPSPEVLAQLGYREDLTRITPVDESADVTHTPEPTVDDVAVTEAPKDEVHVDIARTAEAEGPTSSPEETALSHADDLKAYREELVLQELIRLEANGQNETVDRILDSSDDIDRMEALLMRSTGGGVAGGGSALGDIDASTPEGAARVLSTAGIPHSITDGLDTGALDAMARFAQAYSSGDMDAMRAAHAEVGSVVDKNMLHIVEGALISHHYGLEGAQATGYGDQARMAQVLSDGFQASPQELEGFRGFLGERYDEYLEQVRGKLPPDHPAWSSMSEEELVAVYGYTTNDYKFLNPALRGLDPTSLSELMPYIAAAESGLQKMPSVSELEGSSVQTIRGVGGLPPHLDAQLQPGENFSDRAFMSTSREALDNFKGDYEFHIEGSTGRDVESLSAYTTEREVLYPTGTTFTVIERTVDPDTGRTIIKLKERH